MATEVTVRPWHRHRDRSCELRWRETDAMAARWMYSPPEPGIIAPAYSYAILQAGQTVGRIVARDYRGWTRIGIRIAPEWRGQRVGQQALIAFADQVRRPLRLWTVADNIRAVRCYEQAGFCIIARQFWRVPEIGEETLYYEMERACIQ